MLPWSEVIWVLQSALKAVGLDILMTSYNTNAWMFFEGL